MWPSPANNETMPFSGLSSRTAHSFVTGYCSASKPRDTARTILLIPQRNWKTRHEISASAAIPAAMRRGFHLSRMAGINTGTAPKQTSADTRYWGRDEQTPRAAAADEDQHGCRHGQDHRDDPVIPLDKPGDESPREGGDRPAEPIPTITRQAPSRSVERYLNQINQRLGDQKTDERLAGCLQRLVTVYDYDDRQHDPRLKGHRDLAEEIALRHPKRDQTGAATGKSRNENECRRISRFRVYRTRVRHTAKRGRRSYKLLFSRIDSGIISAGVALQAQIRGLSKSVHEELCKLLD